MAALGRVGAGVRGRVRVASRVPLVKPTASSLPLGEKARLWPSSLSNMRMSSSRFSA